MGEEKSFHLNHDYRNREHTKDLFDSFFNWPKEAIGKEFNTAIWEHINTSEMLPIFEKLGKIENNNTLVLDAGCGSGRLLFGLKTKYTKVIGTDFSFGLLKMAKDKNDSVMLAQGDLSNLPFADFTFDLILCVRVIQHMSPKQQRQAVKEMARVLKKNGKLILMTYNALTILCVYKMINMSGLYKIWPRWPLRDWKWMIDDYCFPWELKRMFKLASLDEINITGSVCGEPEMFKFLKISNFLEKKLNFLFIPYLRLCRKIDFRINKIWPFNFFLGRILIEGKKNG